MNYTCEIARGKTSRTIQSEIEAAGMDSAGEWFGRKYCAIRGRRFLAAVLNNRSGDGLCANYKIAATDKHGFLVNRHIDIRCDAP